MPKLPSVSAKDAIKAFGKLGNKIVLIEYIYKTLNQHEDKENLGLWIEESEHPNGLYYYTGVYHGVVAGIDYEFTIQVAGNCQSR